MSLDATITIYQLIILEVVQFIGMMVTIFLLHGIRLWRIGRDRRQFERDWNEFVGKNASHIIETGTIPRG